MNHTIPDSEIQGLMIGFFSGTLDRNQTERLNKWLKQDKQRLDEFNRMRSAWILWRHRTGKKAFDARNGWPALQQRIKDAGRNRFAELITPMRYAASLALCMTITAVVMMIVTRSKPVENTGDVMLSDASAVPSTTIHMPLGSKSSITLPDGSSVWLNAGSTLTYSTDFGMENRELHLVGEAFFSVKGDSLKPFDVHTIGMTVRALGTRFNVKAYPDDEIMTATLEEGVIDVLLRKTQQLIQLKPNEQIVIEKTRQENIQVSEQTAGQPISLETLPATVLKEVVLIPKYQTELATSWKNTKWIVADASLSEFVTNMERRYNLKFRYDSEELKNYRVSGSFENETVEQILKALSLAAPVNYRIDKNNVKLSLNKAAKEKYDRQLIKQK